MSVSELYEVPLGLIWEGWTAYEDASIHFFATFLFLKLQNSQRGFAQRLANEL